MSAHVTAGLGVLRVVAGRPDPTEPMPLRAIAHELGMTASRASRLCSELEEIGLLERGGAYGSYLIGPAAIRLSGRAAAPFAQSVRFALTLAAQQTGETALLAARSADEMRVVASVESIWTLHSPAEVGDLIEDADTAVLRAADRRDADADGTELSFESTTGMSVEIAAPVLGPTGECVAVLAVRLPINRAGQTTPRARRAVVAASRSVENALADWLDAPRPSPDPAATDEAPSALAAALRILDHLAAGQDSIAGISRATGLRPDRAQRLLESCRRAGFILDGHDRAQSQLSWLVHGWFRAAAAPIMVARGAPLAAETADRTLTCAFITVLKSLRSFTLVEELEMAGEGLRMASWLGRAHPIIGSDGGPTLVMDFGADDLRMLFPSRHTQQELDTFLARVRRVVRDGVLTMEAYDGGGMVSISAPIRDASGTVIAAACLVGTTGHMMANVADFEEATRRLALDVAALLDP